MIEVRIVLCMGYKIEEPIFNFEYFNLLNIKNKCIMYM